MLELLLVREEERAFKLMIQLFDLLVDAKEYLLLPHYFD